MNLRHSVTVYSLVLLTSAVEGRCSEPRLLWETHLNPGKPSLTDSVADMALDARGNVFVTGSTERSDGATAALLARYDAAGFRKWQSVIPVGGKHFTHGNALALDRQGRPIMVATGTNVDGTGGQLVISKWSASGNLLYSALVNQPDGTSAEGVAVAVDANNAFYVVANHRPRSAPADGPTTAYLRKYNPAGKPEWALPLTQSDAQSTQAFAMKFDSAGHVLVTGKAVLAGPAASPLVETAYATFKVSPLGTIEWSDVYARTTRGDNHATAIATDAAGDVYVTGVSSSVYSDTLTAVTTVKYSSASGTRVWVSHFDAIERADDYLGIRSFAGSAITVNDSVWVAANPYLLMRLSASNGSDGGLAYTSQPVDSGVDATIDRMLLLEPGRGLLFTGSIFDDSGSNDLYVQLVDDLFNYGWKIRIHPADTSGSAIVGFARGLNNRLYSAANYFSSTGTPASDGVLFAVAPPVVPTVQVYPLVPLAIEPAGSRPGLAGRFRIKLSNPAEQDLGIWFGLTGQAHSDPDEGLDYTSSASPVVVIPKGKRQADVLIQPVADDLKEGFEDVQLTLQTSGLPTLNDYQLGKQSSARVWILDSTR
jgi:hypothetical protein